MKTCPALLTDRQKTCPAPAGSEPRKTCEVGAVSGASRDRLPHLPHARLSAKPLVRSHFEQRRRRLQRTNTGEPGPALWVDTRSWGRVALINDALAESQVRDAVHHNSIKPDGA